MVKSFVGKEFIYEQSLMFSYAISHQRDQMPMMNPAYYLNFSSEFSLSLSTPCLKLLDGHHFSIRKVAFVNTTKPTLPYYILIRKSTGYFHHLFVAEIWLDTPYHICFWCSCVVHMTPIAVSYCIGGKWGLRAKVHFGWTSSSYIDLLSIVIAIWFSRVAIRRSVMCSKSFCSSLPPPWNHKKDGSHSNN